MLKHSLKQILRNLWRHKSLALINLLGLSIGLAAVVVLFLLARYENTFDQYHSTEESLYRVVSEIERPDGIEYNATVPYPTGEFLRQRVPGIKSTQIHYAGEMQTRIGDNPPILEDDIVFADSLFFQVLDFKNEEDFWISGNPETALDQPNVALLTQSKAKEYFGNQDPVGEVIRLENKVDVQVVGVIKDLSRSHLPISILVSFSTLNNDLLGGLDIESWRFTSGGYTYVRMGQSLSKDALKAAFQEIVERKAGSEQLRKEKFYLQPLKEIHFDTTFESSNPTYTVSSRYLTMLLLLGCFILLIACVNYVNLSTSYAFTKSKEVGIRKTIGASKSLLFFHYLLEAFVLTLFATVVGLFLAVISLPSLNAILDKSIAVSSLLDPVFLIGIPVLTILISVLSGAYPAFILSGFSPTRSLKNQFAVPGQSSTGLRKGLVVFQFTTSIALIICTLIISRQMEYFHKKELGFNKEAVVEVRLPENDSTSRERFRNMLLTEPGIQELTFCLGAPVSNSGLKVGLKAPQLSEETEYTTKVIPSDKDYMETYQLKLLAGRWFLSSEESNIGSAVVINESLARTLGFNNPEDALGKPIELGLNNIRPTIVGVTRDFHTTSLHNDIEDVALTPFPYFYFAAGIRTSQADLTNTLATIENTWRQVYPDHVYNISFIDETLAESYTQEIKNYKVFQAFSVISIFICCIGLWGLISFVVLRKTKEIGIRKILGAGLGSILLLLSKEFLLLIAISIIIASPLSWYLMENWLQDFAYRVNIGWVVFLIAGSMALFIALFTMSFQAIKAALSNPVKNLKVE